MSYYLLGKLYRLVVDLFDAQKICVSNISHPHGSDGCRGPDI